MLSFLAGLGAALGALVRYQITIYGKKHWEFYQGKYLNFPLPTLVINLTGTFILGILFPLKLPLIIYSFLATGVLGGYTTFSTLNVELLSLLHEKKYQSFLFYFASSYFAGILLLFLGSILGKMIMYVTN